MTTPGLKETTDTIAFAQYSTMSSAIGLSSSPTTGSTLTSLLNKPSCALIQAQGQNIRWRPDGTDPSSSVGMILYAGQIMLYDGDLTKIRFIEASGGAVLTVTYLA